MIKKSRISIIRNLSLRLLSSTTTNNTIISSPIDRVSNLVKDGNIFADFTMLATQHKAMNLGQGFPSFGSPPFLAKYVNNVSIGDCYCEDGPLNLNNQYSKPGEELLLSQVLINKYTNKYGINLTSGNICTTVGAQEGIFTTLSTYCNSGDEIAIITPSFDAYFKTALLLGLKVNAIPLICSKQTNIIANDYKLNYNQLRQTLTSKTRLLILNTPSAPLGKVYTKEELQEISNVVQEFPNLLVVSDEVYEYMTYDSLQHCHIATIPNMFERTITLYSFGKTFSCTGWRLGYIISSTLIIQNIKTVHSIINFSTTTLLQKAASFIFQEAEQCNYYQWLQNLLENKRNNFCKVLKELNIDYILPNGGYFIVANMRKFYHLAGITEEQINQITSETLLHDRPDVQFSKWLTIHVGVCPIPMSTFYIPSQRYLANDYIRFAYCKDDKTMRIAGERLLSKLK